MTRTLGVTAAVLVLMLAAIGCKSPSPMNNPFAKKSGETLKSPAEMDELQLKAPPENYTRGEVASKSSGSSNSLAQNGDYAAAPGFSAQAEPAQQGANTGNSQNPNTAQLAQNSPYGADPVKTAMNSANGNGYPQYGANAQNAAAAQEMPAAQGTTAVSGNNLYSNPSAANSSVYPSSGTESTGNTGVFAPGSIGGY